MFTRIQTREIVAWAALAVAFLLLGASIALGQTRTVNVESENGKVHLRISKTENGNTEEIDTTFELSEGMDLDEVIRKIGDLDNTHIHISGDSDSGKSEKKKKRIVMNLDGPEFSEADMEKLNEDLSKSMKDMRKELDKMQESLQSMSIYIDDDGDENEFHFDFDMPDHDKKDHKGNIRSYSYSYSHSDDGLDSLEDDDHIVIIGERDEKAPELEKVISTKNGRQIFIYKRNGNSKEKQKEESKEVSKPSVSGIECYPNPTGGKFTVKFTTDEKVDLLVQVLDNNSKEVFSERLDDFKGEFSREIDLSGKSKGNYFVKISEGKKSVTKKIVIN